MSCALSKKIIKPADCVFLTPLPLNEDEFIHDLECGCKEFSTRFSFWRRYEFEVGSLLWHVTGELKEAGIAVATRATLQDLARSLQSQNPEIVMLMAHWNDRGIEFVDGIADASWILAHLQINQMKFLDLAVCHPEPVMQAIKNHRPNSFAHGPTRRMSASPDVWLCYFSLVAHTLKNTDSTYINASEMAFKGLLNLLP